MAGRLVGGAAEVHGNDDGVIRRADTEECVVGDGGLATSVADLAHRLGFLADGRVLGADIRAALLERAVLADGTVHPYALGVYHFTVGGKAAYGHAGSVDGYRSQLLYVPETGSASRAWPTRPGSSH